MARRAGDLLLSPHVFETADGRYRTPVELGRLTVPENRSNPASGLIDLAFLRIPSTATTPQPPIVYLAGGPGASGIDEQYIQEYLPWPWFLKIRELADTILLDQRGTGRSVPNLESPQRFDLPLDRAVSREEYLEAHREASREAVRFWTERGVDLGGYTTAENADDIDALRQALGADRVSLFGASYGSHLALATIKRHGAAIHRAVIPMVEGPDHTNKLPSNIQRQVEQISALVERDPVWSRHIPNFLELVASVLERLEREPVTATAADPETGEPVAVTFGAFDLQLSTANGLGDIRFLGMLPARYLAMSQGDFSWLAGRVVRRRRSWLGSAMFFHMDCASGATAERQARIEREAEDTLLGDAINFPFPAACDAWGCPDAGEAFRAPIRSDVPVLFISGTLDGRTPVSNGEEIAAGFPNAHHLVIEGMGHDYPNSREEDAIIYAFYKDGSPPPVDRLSVPFSFAPLGG
jgi:pimeloyl-ACP methyl ester carboxylesterase